RSERAFLPPPTPGLEPGREFLFLQGPEPGTANVPPICTRRTMVDTIQERTERRYRRGGLFFMLVGALAALYAVGLHNGGGEPPAYGLALQYVLDWSGRLADRIGGVLGQGWEARAYQVNLGVAAAFTALGFVAWLGSRVHKVFSIFGFV